MALLAQELANPQQRQDIRSSAGIALKNSLTARDSVRRQQLQNQWLSINIDTRSKIKDLMMHSLAGELKPATAAAQVISAIANIELPEGLWPQLIPSMLENVTTTDSSNLKQSSLQALGFICEEISPSVLAPQSNQILTAVVQGARKEESHDSVRIAAINALINSLEFIDSNFKVSNERDFLMQIVCEATSASNPKIVAAAFECLVKIVSLYYEYMQIYMEQALLGLTIQGMRNENEDIALQAIEFWSTVSETEADILDEAEEAAEYGEQPELSCFDFAKRALPELVPSLLELLTKQEEDQDEDEWNPSMAAGTCLALVAQCVGNDIVSPVVPFVEQNIQNQNWHFRDAAVMAFGSILDGPESHVLQPLVTQALPVIVNMLEDPVVSVKDTSAWTLGRISELHPSCISAPVLRALVNGLVRGLQDSPSVASNCAYAILNLAEQSGSEGETMQSYHLSMFFEGMAQSLLEAAQREDGNESNLRTSVYTALASLLEYSAHDCLEIVKFVAGIILDRLESTIAMESQLLSLDDRNQHAETQASLCRVIEAFSRRLASDISPYSDRIMANFLKIFESSTKTTATIEDVFLVIGVIINSLEGQFTRYLDAFSPYLLSALQNHAEHELCGIAVGIVGDLCRALGPAIIPYCDNFMNALVQDLQSGVLHRDVKPPILSAFGDIALAIQANFEKYLSVVMGVLEQASAMKAESDDYDTIDYINSLREGILEAYTGIVQGLKADNRSDLLMPYVQNMIGLLQLIWMDKERSDEVVKAAIGLIGDIADSLEVQAKPFLVADWISRLIKLGRETRSFSPATKEIAKWAERKVGQVLSSA